MKLPFLSKKTKKHARKKIHLELDPRRYWIILLSLFILAIAAQLAYFSWIFWKTQRNIDAPATPILETNAPAIRSMKQTLKEVGAALEERTGIPSGASSQNEGSVVQ